MHIKTIILGVCLGVVGMSTANGQNNQQVVQWMYENDLTRYQDQTSFRGEDFVTRGEIAKFIASYADEIDLEPVADASCVFSDIADYDQTLIPSIFRVCEVGLMKGQGGVFRPAALISEAEALTVAIRSILGVQDETMDPWRSQTQSIATNLGLIQQQGVYELDEPASRIQIGKRLYMLANEYLPKRSELQSNEVYSIHIDDQGVEVVLFDGSSMRITENVGFDPQRENFEAVRTYTDANLSPDAEYVVLAVSGFEREYAQIYDLGSQQIVPNGDLLAIYGTPQGRTDKGRLRIQTCYASGECVMRVSISADRPWIFPEVRALGGEVGFVCDRSTNELLLNIGGSLIMIAAGRCSGVPVSDYQEYDISDDSLIAARTIDDSEATLRYATLAGDQIIVYQGQGEEVINYEQFRIFDYNDSVSSPEN